MVRGERRGDGAGAADVVFRVRVLEIRPECLVVEAPGVFGQSIDLRPGVALVGAMTVGQNRWMFHTTTMAAPGGGSGGQRGAAGAGGHGRLFLAPPTGVERCTRRNFYRISTADLQLPVVECWPLMDPTTVIAAEAAKQVPTWSMVK